MRTKASSKSNMRFLKGNVVFFALLLLAIMLFAYYALKGMDSAGDNSFSCKVSFAKNYTGGECRVFIGDSLLYAGDPCGADTIIEMRRYATEKSKVVPAIMAKPPLSGTLRKKTSKMTVLSL